MKKYSILPVLLIIFVLPVLPSSPEEGEKKSRLTVDFDERFRFVGFDNTITLNDEQGTPFTFTRHRSRFSLNWQAGEDLTVFSRLTNEFRVYLSPGDRAFNVNEVFVENLYLRWKNFRGLPLTLTLGRQNIMLGEGFVVMDGHPLDGSRSIYFNAVRADYRPAEHHRVTAFVAYVPRKDTFMPIINSRDQPLIEQPHWGTGLYYTGDFQWLQTEAYYIYKAMEETAEIPLNASFSTVGMRAGLPFSSALSLTAEGAWQFGNFHHEEHRAYGGYAHLDYLLPPVKWVKEMVIGGILLSGDRPETERHEAWDPLFSRWPKWSESFIYTLILENAGKVAYWSNLTSLYGEVSLHLGERTGLKMAYHRLGALEIPPDHAFVSGNGKNRGGLALARLTYRVNARFSGHVVWEYLDPGNYYFSGADGAHWIRFELMLNL